MRVSNSLWVSAESGAEPETNRRMCATRSRVSPVACQQARVEGRHAHHHRRLGQEPDDFVGVEARQEDERGAGHQRHVGRHEQAVGVEDRQRVQQPVSPE